MRISFFDDNLEKFIGMLEKTTIAKVFRTIDLFEKFGHQLGMPHSKKVDRGIFELRIRGTQEVRIFYVFCTGAAILLHGYIKKTQKMSKRELSTAKSKMRALDKI